MEIGLLMGSLVTQPPWAICGQTELTKGHVDQSNQECAAPRPHIIIDRVFFWVHQDVGVIYFTDFSSFICSVECMVHWGSLMYIYYRTENGALRSSGYLNNEWQLSDPVRWFKFIANRCLSISIALGLDSHSLPCTAQPNSPAAPRPPVTFSS